MRHFINAIDIESLGINKQLYSCPKCEVQLEPTDLKQMGWNKAQCAGRKRLKGVVVDGKVVALLKDLGQACDSHEGLQSTKGISTRVVSNREATNAICVLLKLARSVAARIRSNGYNGNVRSVCNSGETMFISRNGICHMRLTSLLKYASTKAQAKKSKIGN